MPSNHNLSKTAESSFLQPNYRKEILVADIKKHLIIRFEGDTWEIELRLHPTRISGHFRTKDGKTCIDLPNVSKNRSDSSGFTWVTSPTDCIELAGKAGIEWSKIENACEELVAIYYRK